MSHFRLENSPHLDRELGRSCWPSESRGGKKGASKVEEEGEGGRFGGADFRCYRGGTVAPLHGQTTSPISKRRGAATASSTQPGQLFPRGTVLMEATVLARLSRFPHPKIILQNYSNTADVSETLRFTPICKDDSKNVSFQGIRNDSKFEHDRWIYL